MNHKKQRLSLKKAAVITQKSSDFRVIKQKESFCPSKGFVLHCKRTPFAT